MFDWDQTIATGRGGGESSLYDLLENDRIRTPPSWEATSKHLTEAALESLRTYCPLDTGDATLPTSDNEECITAILCIQRESAVWNGMCVEAPAEELCTGPDAFELRGEATPDTVEPAFAWITSLQAGYTPAEISDLSRMVFARLREQPVGATETLGFLTGIPDWVRIYDQMADLVDKLQKNGFEVWISSASPESVVDPLAEEYLDIPAEQVIGNRPLLGPDGLATYDFEGCGTFPDGTQDIINYRLGKRCFINKLIFGIDDPYAQLKVESPITFAAGDSDTDVFFLRDARVLRLVINRQARELMCYAYANLDGRWIINPKFIDPLRMRDEPYDCDPFGLPDQVDTVYCTDMRYEPGDCSAPLR